MVVNTLGPIDHANGKLGLDPIVLQYSQHFNSSCDAQDTIISASRWLRVQVRSSVRRRLVVPQSRTDCKYISHGVDFRGTTKFFGGSDEPISSCLVGG
jgi:hypothetical protein